VGAQIVRAGLAGIRSGAALAMVAMCLAGCGANGEFKMPDLFGTNTPARSQPPAIPPDTGPKTAECPKFEMVASQQKTGVWCWAASAEMIHRYHGRRDIDQAAIAAKIHGVGEDGSPKVQAASYREVMIALNPDLKVDPLERMRERWGQQGQHGVNVDLNAYLGSVIERNSFNTDDLVHELQKRQPVVIGMGKDPRFNGGHAMVIYGVTYQSSGNEGVRKLLDGNNSSQAGSGSRLFGVHEFEIKSVKVMDPWTGEPTEISGTDLAAGMDFAVSQTQARKVLEDEMRALNFR